MADEGTSQSYKSSKRPMQICELTGLLVKTRDLVQW